MEAIWAFFKDPSNLAALTWLGSGVSAIAAGVWAVVRFFSERDRKSSGGQAAGRSVRAQSRGIAAGGDVHLHSGMSGLQQVLLLAVIGGALIAGAGLFGRHVTATGGVAIGGDATSSSITINGRPGRGRD
jgi:hypothetical protein